MTIVSASKYEEITLGGGCFWCTQAVFSRVKGVVKVEAGYSGGSTEHPTYEQVKTGTTGHAEVVNVTFDPSVISLRQILLIFFHVHDPSTLNRQGDDVGTQYRSIILYRDQRQRMVALSVIDELLEEGEYKSIVTQIVPFRAFYPAEAYHQGYFETNGNQPYCRVVIAPKVMKFMKDFEPLAEDPHGIPSPLVSMNVAAKREDDRERKDEEDQAQRDHARWAHPADLPHWPTQRGLRVAHVIFIHLGALLKRSFELGGACLKSLRGRRGYWSPLRLGPQLQYSSIKT